MSTRLSARQPRRLGGWEPERWPRSQQRGALAERPVGGVPAPRTPARPAGPARLAASMGAAAVRWHLCVLLALGARGRLAGGSGLPGKPRAGRRRAQGGGGVPGGPPPRAVEGAAARAAPRPAPPLCKVTSGADAGRPLPEAPRPGGSGSPAGPQQGRDGLGPPGEGVRRREEERKRDDRRRGAPALGAQAGGSEDPGARRALPQGRGACGRKEAHRGDGEEGSQGKGLT